MDTKSLKEPVVIVAVLVLVLQVATWLFPRQPAVSLLTDVKKSLKETNARLGQLENQLAKIPTGNPRSGADELGQMAEESKQFDEAITQAKITLEAEDFSKSYDLILIACRLRPSDPKVLDLVLDFIQKARNSQNDETTLLADDLISRGESLIHFQLPKDVESARQRFMKLLQEDAQDAEKPESPFLEVLNLLAVAENPKFSVTIRTRAAEQARSSLSDVMLSRAVSSKPESDKDDLSENQAIIKKIDTAEQSCIADMFLKAKERADDWLTSTQTLLKDLEAAKADNTPAGVNKLRIAIRAGFELAQEITPYAKSGVSGAADLATQVDDKIALLQRTKTWLYNQQVLNLIRDIESRKSLSTKEKIQNLAQVNEEFLSPYVLKRHGELWDIVFGELKNEDEKVWAVRLRVLQVKE